MDGNQGGRINTPTQTSWTAYTLPISYTSLLIPVAVMGVTNGVVNIYATGMNSVAYKALSFNNNSWSSEPLFFIIIGR